MVNILEQYFVQFDELVLPTIGSISLVKIPAKWTGGTLEAPIVSIEFSTVKTKPSAHFFSFLADALSVSNEQAAIQYEIFLQKCFEEQNAILKIGNLGSVHKTGDQFNWVSSFQSASYFKDISISPIAIDVEEQVVSVKKVKWELVALILSLIAIVAILYKLL